MLSGTKFPCWWKKNKTKWADIEAFYNLELNQFVKL